MTDKLNDSIHRLLARPGLHSVRFLRHGTDVHVEAYGEDSATVPHGVSVPDGGERTLVDAVDCLAAQAWDRGEPPDQLAEARVVELERAARNVVFEPVGKRRATCNSEALMALETLVPDDQCGEGDSDG